MNRNSTTKRVNITLPEDTLQRIDSASNKGNRSRFINQAVNFYIDKFGRENLKKALKEGAIDRAKRDRGMVADWFNAEEELWSEKTK